MKPCTLDSFRKDTTVLSAFFGVSEIDIDKAMSIPDTQITRSLFADL